MPRSTTIGKYLVYRLEEAGLGHIFGIPGDYVLGFYDLLIDSQIEVVGTCTEIGAGFAADGYARVNGLGALCVTYCVGGFNAMNAVAGAYAEKSPVIVISGAPGVGERVRSPLLHHVVRDFNTQLQVFEKITAHAVSLEDPDTAPEQIDACLLACQRYKRPVYLEIPRDRVNTPCASPRPVERDNLKSNPQSLEEAIQEADALIRSAEKPVILAGIEIHRYGLQNQLKKLAEKTGIRVASTLLGKSIISERDPCYLGVYEGALGHKNVREAVESAGCLLILGAFMSDINLGIYTAHLDVSKTINATSQRISIKHHHYEGILLYDFITGLTRALTTGKNALKPSKLGPAEAKKTIKPFRPVPDNPCTVQRFFERMETYLTDDSIVVCDIGDCLFGAADLTIHRKTEFICPAFYTSMGFAVPAAVGAQIGNRRQRPLVFVGDGAFQMTGMELSTVARNGLNPIVFVLNNKGYTTERIINEGPYNDIHEWAYHLVPQILRKGWGCEVHTEGELEEALITATSNRENFSLINVHLDKYDLSRALQRFGKRLSKQVKTPGAA